MSKRRTALTVLAVTNIAAGIIVFLGSILEKFSKTEIKVCYLVIGIVFIFQGVWIILRKSKDNDFPHGKETG
jgi:undecaprenyl pyrophosphate phosphatase UppP